MILFLMLLLVPIVEIGLFIEVGGWLGLWPTIAIVILTAVIGTVLLRQQGIAALADLQSRLSRGDDPGGALAHGAMILVAGILLLTPGFFTDTVGFILLFPPARAVLIRWLAARIQVAGSVHMASAGQSTGSAWPPGSRGPATTIDGEYESVDPSDQTDRPPRA
ncbi:MAG: FxsA family protein [Pseudomonadota bacterium]